MKLKTAPVLAVIDILLLAVIITSARSSAGNGKETLSTAAAVQGTEHVTAAAQDNAVSAQTGNYSHTVELEETEAEGSAAASGMETPEQNVNETMKADADTSAASAMAAAPAFDAVSGGEWIQVASIWFYQKDGELVKDSWINDNGIYYYVDESGYMMSNAFTPEGYFVGEDGSYDPNAPQNQPDGGNYIQDAPAGEAMAAIAARLSTEKNAGATEFDWFLDYVNNGGSGSGSGQVITNPSLSTQVSDLQPALNGGWKCFICTEKGVFGSDVERYLNAQIEASGGKFNITLNWKYMRDPNGGETVEETGSTTYRGTYDDAAGTATAQSSDSRVEFDGFYLSTDGLTEYATGYFYWISGETDRIALMRSAD